MSLFNVYDGTGPVRRIEITERAIKPQLSAVIRDAHAAPGLYVQHTAPVYDPQIAALGYAPGVDFSAPLSSPEFLDGAAVTYD